MRNARLITSCIINLASLLVLLGTAVAKPYSNPKGYTITPPANWTTEKSTQGDAAVRFSAPVAQGFAANVLVVVAPAAPKSTLEGGVKQINAAYPRIFPGYKKLAQGFTTVGGLRALYNTANLKNGKPPQLFRMHQVVVLKKNLMYTITCTSLDADYAKYHPVFTAMLKSVRWTQ